MAVKLACCPLTTGAPTTLTDGCGQEASDVAVGPSGVGVAPGSTCTFADWVRGA
jgi:hypothetical protein